MAPRLVVVLLGLCALGGASVGRGRRPDHSTLLTLNGPVRVTTSTDGLTVVVTIDAFPSDRALHGLVDHASRVQLKVPQQAVRSGGLATVIYRGRSLVAIALDPERGWVFSLDGPVAPPGQSATAGYDVLPVGGVSRFWGDHIHRAAQDAAALLLRGACTAGEGDPSCDNCRYQTKAWSGAWTPGAGSSHELIGQPPSRNAVHRMEV
jgi:hypothetical protein